MQSSVEGSTPSRVRISLALDSPSLLLKRAARISRVLLRLRAQQRDPDLLLDGRHVFGLELALGEQLGCDPALEQQALSGHLHQDETDQLAQIHPADHLLKSVRQTQQPSGKPSFCHTHVLH